MLFGLMPHLMPALQPPSVSHWQRATAVTHRALEILLHPQW